MPLPAPCPAAASSLIHLHTLAWAEGQPWPKGRLLPSYFLGVFGDRTLNLWGLETKMIFHVPFRKIIDKSTQTCLYPVLTRNMQFLLTAFKGPAVNSVKQNSYRDNIFLTVMLRSHLCWCFMMNVLTTPGTCLQEEDTLSCVCFAAE